MREHHPPAHPLTPGGDHGRAGTGQSSLTAALSPMNPAYNPVEHQLLPVFPVCLEEEKEEEEMVEEEEEEIMEDSEEFQRCWYYEVTFSCECFIYNGLCIFPVLCTDNHHIAIRRGEDDVGEGGAIGEFMDGVKITTDKVNVPVILYIFRQLLRRRRKRRRRKRRRRKRRRRKRRRRRRKRRRRRGGGDRGRGGVELQKSRQTCSNAFN